MSKFMILHLEDDLSLKETVYELLSAVEPDSDLYQFTNSDDAIHFIDENGQDIGVYLLDVRVPGSTDGIGVARRIREREISSPIVFMSAYQRPSQDVLNEDLHYEWINKPWSVERLIDVLERARGQQSQ